MIKVVSNDQMRRIDAYTINELNVPGIILMENAGRHSYEYIMQFIKDHNINGIIAVFCGKGNNGGDGYVIARHLINNGIDTKIYSIGDPEELNGDAAINYRICKNYNIPTVTISSLDELPAETSFSLIIDALLGTGLKGPVKGLFGEVIAYINRCRAHVVSIDIPSGLDGDFPVISGPAIQADLTISMALPKRAHLFYPARKNVGILETADISIPDFLKMDSDLKLNLVEFSDLSFPQISEDEHKYSAGKLFILAGARGMTGAASLAANAALRSGVGLLNIGVPESLNNIIEIKVTEGLSVPLPETVDGTISISAMDTIEERIQWSDAVVLGPGCGRHKETLEVLLKSIVSCIQNDKPLLIDADALFALTTDLSILNQLNKNVILTPHHGEFLRLTSFQKADLLHHPWQCLIDFLADKDFVINLKGAPSMVGKPEGELFINPTGNPGLAKGGSGDVLTGIIGALMAKGLSVTDAGITGNYIHGEAADILADAHGYHTILPSDLIEVLPDLFD